MSNHLRGSSPHADGRPSQPPVDAEAVVNAALRRLLRAEDADEVREALLAAVHGLGGRAVAADTDDPDALPLDLALGHGPPVLPAAPAGSAVRSRLERELSPLVADAREAVDRLARQRQLTAEVVVDPLTRIGNRTALQRLMPRLTARDCLVALDLDGFKGVNDTLGHATGDELLRAFAGTLRDVLRATDHAVREGGDEFTLVLTDTPVDAAARVTDRLREDWRRRRPQQVTFSAGVAAWAGSADATRRLADARLYDAKQAGGDRATVS